MGWSLSTPRMNWKSRQPPGKWIECRTRPVFSRRMCLDRGRLLASKVSRGDSASSGLLFNRRNDARILDSIAQEKEPIALCLVENFNFPAY